MKPIIYCIEAFEYFNPYGEYSEKHDRIEFLVTFSCREGTAQLEESLSHLVGACKKHEPALYHYIQNLLANMEEFFGSDSRLIEELERDGFDFSRLLQVYYDNYDLEHLANWIKTHGIKKPRTTVSEIQKLYAEIREDDSVFDEYFALTKRINKKVYKEMKGVLFGYLPTFKLLETKQLRKVQSSLKYYALAMVESMMNEWGKIEEWEDDYEDYYEDDFDDDFDDEEVNDLYSVKAQRRFQHNFRKNYPEKGCEDNPIFCVEIVEMVDLWETMGRNYTKIWYKLTCAEGEWYGEVDLENLLDEALLHFPAIYQAAREHYDASNSPRPRHPAILYGLKQTGHDLTPVLASYISTQRNFLPDLREDNRLKNRFPDFENSYVRRRQWDEEEKDPIYAEEAQLVSLLHDDLVNIGIKVILRELPKLQSRVHKTFLRYMGISTYELVIDPINDFHDELETALALRREHKKVN